MTPRNKTPIDPAQAALRFAHGKATRKDKDLLTLNPDVTPERAALNYLAAAYRQALHNMDVLANPRKRSKGWRSDFPALLVRLKPGESVERRAVDLPTKTAMYITAKRKQVNLSITVVGSVVTLTRLT